MTHSEKHKVLLIVLPDTVIDPRAVVVHLADAALAHGAVMRALRLDAAAFGALEDHLALAEAHLLNGFLGGVALRHCALKGSFVLKSNRFEGPFLRQSGVG